MTFVNRINVDYVFLTEEAKNSLMDFALKYTKETHLDWNTILMQILQNYQDASERKVVLEEFRRYCLFLFVFVDILKGRSSKFPCSVNTRKGVALICIGILTSPIQQSQYWSKLRSISSTRRISSRSNDKFCFGVSSDIDEIIQRNIRNNEPSLKDLSLEQTGLRENMKWIVWAVWQGKFNSKRDYPTHWEEECARYFPSTYGSILTPVSRLSHKISIYLHGLAALWVLRDEGLD